MRSKFVTGLGWFSIVVFVLMGGAAVLLFSVLAVMSTQPEVAIQLGLAIQEQSGQFVDLQVLPEMLRVQAISMGALSLGGLVISIGLLKRKEWARKSTLVVIAVATLGMAPQLLWSELPAAIPRWLTAGIFFLAALVHWDIMRRLMRPDIRAEFKPQGPERAH